MKLLAGLLLVGVAAFALAMLQRGRAAAAWQRFAEVHGFRIEDRAPTRPLGRVIGSYEDCPVRLEILTRTDLHRTQYDTYAKMSIRIGQAPLGLSVCRAIDMPQVVETISSKLQDVLGISDRRLRPDAGDGARDDEESFFARHSVRGDDARRTLRWLTPARRRTLREFCAEDGYLISDSSVAWTSRFAPTSLAVLEEIYARLTVAARALQQRD